MRFLVTLALALVITLAAAATASAHAELRESSPSVDAKLAASPDRVTLTFTEPIQLVSSDHADVVDSDGTLVSDPARLSPDDARVVILPLRGPQPDGTYTVRYSIIGADSHIIPGSFVFGVGVDELGEPYFAGEISRGPSETSAWAVSARFLELASLGGLLGLLAFRWLVWQPALRRAGELHGGERDAVVGWGVELYWFAFGVLAVVAMISEAYLLIVQSASALGVGLVGAIQDTQGVSQVLADTRFGELVQLRGGLLFAVFAIGAFAFFRETGQAGQQRDGRSKEEIATTVALVALLLAVLGGVAAQGHPSVASTPALQIGAQLIHLATVAVWVTGLALIVVTFVRIPRVAPDGGRALTARLLAGFSRVALVVVTAAILTGVVRSVSELGDPAELWTTGYGRSILYKLLLLCPIAFVALYNRRIVTSLRDVERPSRATISLVRRTAGAELVLSVTVVIIASLLVAQVPGAGA